MQLSLSIKWLAFPILWWFKPYSFDSKWINGFVKWFGSIVGFKQQMAFIMAWVAVDVLNPSLDPNMLHLMVWLTIYSGVTQPMIAIQNTQSSHQNDEAIKLMTQVLKTQSVEIEALKAMIEEMKEARHEKVR